MIRELFQYIKDDYVFRATAESWDDFTPPRDMPTAKSLWVGIALSRRSCRKTRGSIGRDPESLDNRLLSGNTPDGLAIAYDLIKLFKKWIAKESPNFLTISPYMDTSIKRVKLYDRVLRQCGYVPYEVNVTYTEPVITYCRKGLEKKDITIKSILTTFYGDDLY